MQVLTGLDKIREAIRPDTVFGEPIERDGTTVVPVARVAGGGGLGGDEEDNGGGGLGLSARVTGAFVIRNGSVSWVPAVDVNRIVLGGQLAAAAVLLLLVRRLRGRRH
jgi:uncharacterized spore protein YtfJ